MATHSSVLDWKIPWIQESGGYSPWGLRESYMTEYSRTASNVPPTFFVSTCSSVAKSCPTPWTVARQASLSFTFSLSLLKLLFIESVMPSSHLVLCRPLLLLPSVFPSIRSFPISWLFASGGQSIGASASVLPVDIRGWSPLGCTGWVSAGASAVASIHTAVLTPLDAGVLLQAFSAASPTQVFSLSSTEHSWGASLKTWRVALVPAASRCLPSECSRLSPDSATSSPRPTSLLRFCRTGFPAVPQPLSAYSRVRTCTLSSPLDSHSSSYVCLL